MTNHYKKIKIQDYSYVLPYERIAKYPEPQRDKSRLLYYSNRSIKSFLFNQLPDLLQNDDLLFFNNAKVIQARIEFKRETGARIEVFCLEPFLPADYNLAFQAQNNCQWKCLVGNLKKWKNEVLEKKVEINGYIYLLKAEKKSQDGSNNHTGPEYQIIDFSWQHIDNDNDGTANFGDILENSGSTPLPPYLNRKAENEDKTRYQTVYARREGSVAAPTAGLHFTEAVFDALKAKGICKEYITLHVGAGTFRPVKSEFLVGHEMHEEHFEVDIGVIEKIMNHKGRLLAVGTTSVRTLESLYWMGVKILQKSLNPFFIEQWEVYEFQSDISLEASLSGIRTFMLENNLNKLLATTRIMIVPGYTFRVIYGMITNFHQPQSTLLLLIAAVVGEKWKELYGYALENNYRFLSYGDSSLLII